MRKAGTELDILRDNTKYKKQSGIVQISLVIVLTILTIFIALPGYLSGKSTWRDLPKVSGINQLKSLETKRLNIPGWQTTDLKNPTVGTHKWSAQIISSESVPQAQLFLLPQKYYRSKPEVEWVDVDGFERWQTETIETLELVGSTGNLIQARFFKARNAQTYAVVQWYTWPSGGDYRIFPWFWQDELAQTRGSRAPWIAVSLKIIMSPLDELQSKKALAQKLAQSIQKVLEQEVFTNSVR